MNLDNIKSFGKENPRSLLSYLFSIGLFVGLICSKFLITVFMIGFVILGVSTPNLKQKISGFWKNKSYLFISGIFILFLISGLFSSNWADAVVRLRIALPLLVLPLAFSLLPTFSKKQYYSLLTIFFYLMSLACLGVLVNYLLNYDEMQQRLIVSKAIPTPNGEHIRFSLMINLAVFAGFALLKEKFYWNGNQGKWLNSGLILFLVIMLHILSVRIGLVVLYAGLMLTAFYYIVKQQHYWLVLVLVIGAVLLPYLAYKYVPSVRTKIDLTRHNFHMYQQGHIGEYSDTRRLLSYKIAFDVAKQSPWFGVGIGDLKDEQSKIYKAKYPHQTIKYPHNFFLTLYAGTGILGLLFFLLCFLFPLFYQQNYKHLFFLLFYMTIFLSFMTENTLMSVIGVGIYSFFLLLSINYFEQKKDEKEIEFSLANSEY